MRLFHRIHLFSNHLHLIDLLRNCCRGTSASTFKFLDCIEQEPTEVQEMYYYLLECSYSPLALAWLSNSARMPSRSSLRRALPGAGPRPRWGLYIDIYGVVCRLAGLNEFVIVKGDTADSHDRRRQAFAGPRNAQRRVFDRPEKSEGDCCGWVVNEPRMKLTRSCAK